jgi:hypothetical protein
MKAQTAKRMVQIQAWAAQISAWKQSGQTIRQWCVENGMDRKTFYYHRKRVQEEMLEAYESTTSTTQLARSSYASLPTGQNVPDIANASFYSTREKPAFVSLPMPHETGAAISVRLGDYAVDIQNDADSALIEQVLRVVSRL